MKRTHIIEYFGSFNSKYEQPRNTEYKCIDNTDYSTNYLIRKSYDIEPIDI